MSEIENPLPFRDNTMPNQQELITEFIAHLRSLPYRNAQSSLEQDKEDVKTAKVFLRARKMNLQRALELFKVHERMRYTEQLFQIDPLDESVRKELVSSKFTIFTKSIDDDYLPSSPSHQQETVNLRTASVAVFRAMYHWPPSTTHRDTLKGVLFQLEAAIKDEDVQCNGIDVVYDMRDARYANFDFFLCVKLVNLLKGVFPIRLRRILVLSSPRWFRYWYNILLLFVDEKLRHRIFLIEESDLPTYISYNATALDLLTQNYNEDAFVDHHSVWLNHCLQYGDYLAKRQLTFAEWWRCGVEEQENIINASRDRLSSGDDVQLLDAQEDTVTTLRRESMPATLTPLSNFEDCVISSELRSCLLLPRKSVPVVQYNNNNNRGASVAPTNHTDPSSSSRQSCSDFIESIQAPTSTTRLSQEFDTLFSNPRVDQKLCTRFFRQQNHGRNRYIDVPCIDSTALAFPDNTYLHANWVSSYDNDRAYIVAQAPLPTTCRDFWLAVWHFRVPIILMLTRVFESGRSKCSQYWPECSPDGSSSSAPSLTFGEFRITNLGEELLHDGLITKTHLQLERIDSSSSPDSGQTSAPLQVTHIFYNGWPDFDVPNNSSDFLTLLDYMNGLRLSSTESASKEVDRQRSPILIHCSAGIGRTGTYLAADICLQQARHEGYLDVIRVVTDLRRQRAGSVQLPNQYVFLHNTLAFRIAELAAAADAAAE